MADTVDSGTQRLIDDLLEKPPSFARGELLTRARKLWYHDYRSPYATPEGALIKHLTLAGYPDLAERVLDDRYSQRGTDEHKKWSETEEGREGSRVLDQPGVREGLTAAMQQLKTVEGPMLEWARRCIRTKDFRHPVFDDRKVYSRRESN